MCDACKNDDNVTQTAYPETERKLRATVADLEVLAETFDRPLTRCDLSVCRGMCCYDGIYVSDEGARVIQEVAKDHAAFFRENGLDLPDQVIVDAEWRGETSGKKTAVRHKQFSAEVEGYPAHFEDTACVFLMQDGRCGLQALSVSEGLHPWYYKPTGCWMHPLALQGEKRLELLVHNRDDDPYNLPGYEGYVSRTFCGRAGYEPARAVLADELRFLGDVLGRDLLGDAQKKAAEES